MQINPDLMNELAAVDGHMEQGTREMNVISHPGTTSTNQAQAQPAAANAIPETVLIAQMLQMIGHGLAASFGDHWAISQPEADALAVAYDPVLQKYLPNMSMSVEFTAVLTTGMIFVPKYIEHRKTKNDGKQSESKQGKQTHSHNGNFGNGKDNPIEKPNDVKKDESHILGPESGSQSDNQSEKPTAILQPASLPS
tara:strand:- start:1406 stop:1993 length:588 start_codon:yes stop_codon:yes gene_type:complete